MNTHSGFSRREFVKSSAAVSLGVMAAGISRSHARGSDTVKVALIGCGSRGTGAASNCLSSGPGIELTVLADVFEDKLNGSLATLKKRFGDRVKVDKETGFLGFDAYKKVMASDVDIVILATPPGFRPMQVRAAIEAGKHVFMEKPGAVDPVGVRSLLKTAEMADEKNLSIVVGTQQRRMHHYKEIIQRIHDGRLGRVVGGQCYWNWGSSKWHFQHRKPEWSDMEWQIRCWPYFVWLSGDHYVEQHLHNIDIINWAIGTHPIKCLGMGGRQARTGPEFGNIYDHFTVEFEYPGGIRVMSMASQIEGSTPRVGERVVCQDGATWTDRGGAHIEGDKPYKYEGEMISGLVKEHADLVAAVRANEPINECRQLAESTMCVVMGRMSAYTGRALKWDWAMNASKLDLRPEKYELGDLPVRPVAVPGKTQLV